MSNLDLTSKQWVDLVFEGKNKEFGAYEMRRDSPKRHNIAMLIVLAATIFVVFLPSLIRFVAPKQKEKVTEVTTLANLEAPEVKNNDEIKKLDAPPPPPLKSSIKFTPPVIKKDEEVPDDEMKSQEDILKTDVTVSIADVVGNDEEHGKLIADVQEIAQEEPKPVEEDKPFQSVEQMPQFPGGNLNEYLSKNIRYPAIAAENGVEGRVVVQFTVAKDGSIKDIIVLSPVDRALDEEAVRVVKGMPNWIPGKQNGVNVSVLIRVPVTFKLQNR